MQCPKHNDLLLYVHRSRFLLAEPKLHCLGSLALAAIITDQGAHTAAGLADTLFSWAG